MDVLVQALMYAAILSRKWVKKLAFNLPAASETPRYLNGIVPGGMLVKHLISSRLGPVMPAVIKLDLLIFARSPEQSLKEKRYSIRIPTEMRSPLAKSIKSSAKAKCVIFKWPHFGWKLKSMLLATTLTDLKKYSRHNTKRKCEIGSPCLSPFLPLKILLNNNFHC